MQAAFVWPWSQTVATTLNPDAFMALTNSLMHRINCVAFVHDLQKL